MTDGTHLVECRECLECGVDDLHVARLFTNVNARLCADASFTENICVVHKGGTRLFTPYLMLSLVAFITVCSFSSVAIFKTASFDEAMYY